jgi:hypothetical protein
MVSQATTTFLDELEWLNRLKEGKIADSSPIKVPLVAAREVQKHCELITQAYERLRRANPDKLPLSIAPAVNGPVGECLADLKRMSDQLDGGKMLNETEQKELFSHAIGRLQTAVQTSEHRHRGV